MAAVSGTDFSAATLADPDTAEGGGRAGQARYSYQEALGLSMCPEHNLKRKTSYISYWSLNTELFLSELQLNQSIIFGRSGNSPYSLPFIT